MGVLLQQMTLTYKEVKKGTKGIIFLHRYRNKGVHFFGIKAPGDVKGWEETLSKIEQKLMVFSKHKDVQDCLFKRAQVRDASMKISHLLDSITGD